MVDAYHSHLVSRLRDPTRLFFLLLKKCCALFSFRLVVSTTPHGPRRMAIARLACCTFLSQYTRCSPLFPVQPRSMELPATTVGSGGDAAEF